MTTLSTRLGSELRFRFASSAFSAETFDVVDLDGYEAIGKPFRFTLTLVSDDDRIDFDKMLQNAATLCIYSPDGVQEVPYHGVIGEFEQLQRVGSYAFYKVVLVPRLWRLSLYQISEVYLNEQTIPEILEAILKGNKFSSSDYQFFLSGEYRKRSFVCQFEETHLDFLSRWMEKEGLYYFFDHGTVSDGVDKLLIADALIGHPAPTREVKYRPADELDTGVFADCVQDFSCRQKPLPNRVIVQDYNYRKAALKLQAEAPVSADGVGDVMFYGENFRSVEEGQRYARLRAEEIVCRSRVFSAESTAVGLRSGYFMALSHHYRDDVNGKYLVTEMHHRGSQAGVLLVGLRTPLAGAGRGTVYSNSFCAIAAATQFRPERVTPKPRIAGTMNATVDAEGSGDYAELDEFGQYKVQLPFDLTDKAANKGSARVRMATPYSGAGHGMHFPLLKNAEVLLSFVDGDPDQPVIMGAVPNSENRSIVSSANPAANRIRSKGGNQIQMNDAKGKTGMALHSPKGKTSLLLGASKGDGSADGGSGSGIKFLTLGGSEHLVVGNAYEATIGMANSACVGAETSFNVGLINEMKLGAQFSFSYGPKVEWSAGSGCTIESDDVVELNTKFEKQADKSIELSAGYHDLTAVKADILDELRGKVKLAAMAIPAVNAALGVVASAVLLARSDGDESQDARDSSPWETTLEATGIAVASGVISTGLAAVMLAGMKVLSKTYQELKKVSTIKMDAKGIVQATSMGEKSSEFSMKDDGVFLKTGVGSARRYSLLHLKPSSVILRSSSSVVAEGGGLMWFGSDHAIKAEYRGLKIGMDNVVMQNTPASAMTIRDAKVTVKSPTITLDTETPGNGFSATGDETKMVFGTAKVVASQAGLSLIMPGAGNVGMKAGAVSIAADGLIKIG